MGLMTVQELHEVLGPEKNFIEALADGLSAAIDSSLALARNKELNQQLVTDCITPLLLNLAAARIMRVNPLEDRRKLEHYFMSCAAAALLESLGDAAGASRLHS